MKRNRAYPSITSTGAGTGGGGGGTTIPSPTAAGQVLQSSAAGTPPASVFWGALGGLVISDTLTGGPHGVATGSSTCEAVDLTASDCGIVFPAAGGAQVIGEQHSYLIIGTPNSGFNLNATVSDGSKTIWSNQYASSGPTALYQNGNWMVLVTFTWVKVLPAGTLAWVQT